MRGRGFRIRRFAAFIGLRLRSLCLILRYGTFRAFVVPPALPTFLAWLPRGRTGCPVHWSQICIQ